MHRKKNGSYYTPSFLSKFIFGHISSTLTNIDSLSVLEPSIGDGSFVEAFNNTEFPPTINRFSFTGVEKFLPELRKAEDKAKIKSKRSTKYLFVKDDFLKFQKSVNKKFTIIAGNPPYIKKGLLGKEQVLVCNKIHSSAILSKSSVKNIWTAFLVRCTQLLTENGVLAFVLPAELLQVKFAKELRSFLVANFQRTEIFTFDDLLFDCKGQDTILFIGFKQSLNPGQFFSHIEDISQLENKSFHLSQNSAIAQNDTKWAHHFLQSDELNYIYNLRGKLQTLNHYCESKPGIVTAANNFFIIDKDIEDEFDLSRYTKPIIQKGLYVNGGVVFGKSDYECLVQLGLPTKVLCFDDNVDLTENAKRYLRIGKSLKLHERYKCKARNNWFVVPNISTIPEGFFFKRSHFYPKLLKNDTNALVTDSAYKIEMRTGFTINNLIFSFYNSLSLLFAEIEGRYYGGGVLELTPVEFKNVVMPYVTISNHDFLEYSNDFKNKTNIQSVLTANDLYILNTALKVNQEEVDLLRKIYLKLITKRIRQKEIIHSL